MGDLIATTVSLLAPAIAAALIVECTKALIRGYGPRPPRVGHPARRRAGTEMLTFELHLSLKLRRDRAQLPD